MNPNFLDDMSWEMAEVYGAITDQILVNLSHYFRYYVPGDKIPRTAFEYQAAMLAQMGKVNADTIRIIRNGLKDADEALSNTLEQAIIDSVQKCNPELIKGVKRGILAPQSVPVVAPNQYRAFNLYYGQAANKLNLVNTVMLESTQSAYKQAISDVVSEIELADRVNRTAQALDVAAGEMVTGVSSWNQALRHAAARMREGGLTGFVDHAGRQWSAEAYVAMDIRTTTFNTGRAAIWETNQNFGNDLYLVSYHNGARPGCYPYQNKVVSALDAARTVIDLDGNEIEVIAQSNTSYGEPAGLFGINCKHYPQPFIPGVSKITGEPQNKEDNDRAYAESQEQRRLERQLREEKREIMAAKAQGASDEEIKYLRGKARETSQQIDDFCDRTGRARHRDREAVYTQREFPSRKKYDVSLFEKEQQETIRQYFSGGGSQTGFTFGQMTPLVPLVPKPKPTPPPQNVAPQATTAPAPDDTMNYGKPFEDLENRYRKPQIKQFEDAKDALRNAPDEARGVWDKVADDMKRPDFNSTSGAYYRSASGTASFESYKEAFEMDSCHTKNTTFFHEYGHNIDDLLGRKLGNNGYYSVTYLSDDGKMFVQTLTREIGDVFGDFYLKENGFPDAYEAVKAAQNGTGGMGFGSYMRQMLRGVMPPDEWRSVRDMLSDAGDDDGVLKPLADKWLNTFLKQDLRDIARTKGGTKLADTVCEWMKSHYTIYERATISDAFGNYMVRNYGSKYSHPFDVGHSASYQRDASHLPVESFAEFYAATVARGDELTGIKDILPESYAFFLEMLKGALK